MSVPNLVIRRPSVVQGALPGCAELLANVRRNSGASIVSSNSGGSSPENNNYLRVSAAFGQRRLSDNVLTSSGGGSGRRLSSGLLNSAVSSPGSAPGSPLGVGFPIRRHSSAAFAANRRYSSNALLSPSTAAQVSPGKPINAWAKNCSEFRLTLSGIFCNWLCINLKRDGEQKKSQFIKRSWFSLRTVV